MKRYLLISVQPQHLLNILIGKKSIELRKMIPKWVFEAIKNGETVICLLYCTKSKPLIYQDYATNEDGYTYLSGYGIASFDKEACIINGKIVGQFELNQIEQIELEEYNISGDISDYILMTDTLSENEILEKSCLTESEINYYWGDGKLFAMFVNNLKTYSKLKQLNEYKVFYSGEESFYPIKRAPQNMMEVWSD
jgi:predicted transcriptional regulator